MSLFKHRSLRRACGALYIGIIALTHSAATFAATSPGTEALPRDMAHDVAVDTPIVLRLAAPLEATSPVAENVSLVGPHGPENLRVDVADDGLSMRLTPVRELFPTSRYDVFVSGLRLRNGESLPRQSWAFHTGAITIGHEDDRLRWAEEASAKKRSRSSRPDYRFPEALPADDDVWVPTAEHLNGHWRTGRELPGFIRAETRLALSALSREAAWREGKLRSGATEVTGLVLGFSDRPLANVKVTIGEVSSTTDAEGRFRFVDIAPGHHELVVDGTDASGLRGEQYAEFIVGIDVEKHRQNPVKPIYLPKIRASDWIELPSPLPADLRVTSSSMPGFEVRLPKGAVLRDRKGKLVRRIAMVPMPLDRTPIDYPVNTPLHMTFQPAGLTVESLEPGPSEGIRFVYPNYTGEAPGSTAGFLNYDAAGKGWFTYGYGKVSADGRHVEPDTGTQVYRATGFGIWFGPPPPPQKPSNCANPATDGDPVDLRTGVFLHRSQGPEWPDGMPFSLRTNYRTLDTQMREFGRGTSHSYGMYLYLPGNNGHSVWEDMSLVLPDCSVIVFRRTSTSTTLDYTYQAVHEATPSPYFGARMYHRSTLEVEIVRRDGTRLYFSRAGGQLLRIKDAWGRQVEIAREGGQISRITTQSGRFVDVTMDGSLRVKTLKDAIGREWRYNYDTSGRLETVTYPDSSVERYVYDTAGRITEVYNRRNQRMVLNVYDATGRVSDQTLADGAQYHFAYTTNATGDIIETQVTRPNGAIRRVKFHASGLPSEETQALGTTLERTVRYERNSAGFVTATVDPLNRRTEVEYYPDQRVKAVTQLADTSQARRSEYTYTPDGDLATATDPFNRTVTYEYDDTRRLIAVTDPYNKRTVLGYDDFDRLVSVTDPYNQTTTFGYDLFDLTSVTDPQGRTSRRFVDTVGRTSGMVDALGRRSEIHYDDALRMVQARDANGGVTTLHYDAMGNTEQLIDALNRRTAWTYDAMQRPLTQTDALNQPESWSYAPDGSAATHTDRKQQTTTISFDKLERPTTVTYHDGSTTTANYDIADRLLSIVESGGTLTYTYDDFDRATSETTPDGSIGYAFDTKDRLSTITPSGQLPVVYGYDTLDRLASLTRGSEVVSFGFDAQDRRNKVTLPNGISTTAQFDALSQLQSLTYKKGTTTIGDIGYAYDTAGQLTAQTGSFAPGTLPNASISAATVDANNRLTSFAGLPVQHDANGNLTDDGVNQYIYDVRDRLVQITQGATTVATFSYDALGRRVEKAINGTTTRFRYDGENTIAETSGGTTLSVFAGPGIDERYARDDVNGRSYFMVDHLGSTVGLTDLAGELIAQYHYKPYGGSTVELLKPGTNVTNPYRYTGRELDGDSFYYYRARYYQAGFGRFLAEDPMGFVDGTNTYAYVIGQPLQMTDPLGLSAMDGVWGAVYWATNGWEPSQPTLNFVAGVGDGFSMGLSKGVRNLFDIGGGVNTCSTLYRGSEFLAGSIAPAGRLAYIARLSFIGRGAKSLEYALAVAKQRNTIKAYFRGQLAKYFTDYKTAAQVLAKYGNNPQLIINSARASNPYVNSLVFTAMWARSIRVGMDAYNCGCDQ